MVSSSQINSPARGTGKSTTARLCAERLGFRHLEHRRDVPGRYAEGAASRYDHRKLPAPCLRCCSEPALRLRGTSAGCGRSWTERGVSKDIRSPEVSALVSEVSAIPAVRLRMVVEQRRVAAQDRRLSVEGRDIGSVVFPDADLKVFIECDADQRARRRQLELAGQGVCTGQEAVLANLVKRDRIARLGPRGESAAPDAGRGPY